MDNDDQVIENEPAPSYEGTPDHPDVTGPES